MNDVDRWIYFDGPEPDCVRPLKYVRFFTRADRGRAMFEAWLRRRGRYQEMIAAELRAQELPEDLIWVAMIESGFDARARSPAGAVGLWQFMPATGAVYGLSQSRFIDQRKNPRIATQAAAHHLRDLYLRFGAWDLALAAYNMGYEQLLDVIDREGTADLGELARREAIPRETAAYVPKIAAAAIVGGTSTWVSPRQMGERGRSVSAQRGFQPSEALAWSASASAPEPGSGVAAPFRRSRRCTSRVSGG